MSSKTKSVKSSSGSRNKGLEVYSEAAMRQNFSSLEYARTCHAAASGMAAGILGLTNMSGFIFYFVTVLLQALFWVLKSNFKWKTFFLDGWLPITHSLVGGLFTYILFWVFLYGMVHVY
ncbi:hypothetical protein WR25_20349 [Diploscapter pachys]|uniref:ER membrane protein complex subunit 6 n=1 Tax=Diploscapter pachys TaxID=2018661 RepID=A0A2A2J1F7_9BILA|nr:hypothetical protein WR25_20349 [Diploscapter pachys]